jgi:hypothetical protein
VYPSALQLWPSCQNGLLRIDFQLYKPFPQGGLAMCLAEFLSRLKMELMQNDLPQLIDLLITAITGQEPI